MTNPFTEDFIAETAKEFDLDPGPLRKALSKAYDVYEEEADLLEYQAGLHQYREEIRDFRNRVRHLLGVWRKYDPKYRRAVQHFITGREEKGDDLGKRLKWVKDLLDDYLEHYNYGRGNPRKSRSGSPVNLRPLELFTEVIFEYWIENSEHPFGHETKKDFEPEDKEEMQKVTKPKSIALRFLFNCAQRLNKNYSVRNCVTCARTVKGL